MTFVILHPALTCPGLLKREGSLEILLLSESGDVRGDLSSVTYSRFKGGREQSVDVKEVEILPFNPSDYHISEDVLSVYGKRGFKKVVRARIHLDLEKGLYQLKNASEDAGVIEGLAPPLLLRSPSPPDGCRFTSFFSEKPVEIYHPFYVGENDFLTLAHVSDSHLCAHMQMLEERWDTNFNNAWSASAVWRDAASKPGAFSNYVKQFEHLLSSINADRGIDVIIHTGDIVDYNRGYLDTEGRNDLDKDYYFHRNWLLFYELLLNHYEKPFFAVLGNHDYRVHPYAPNPVLFSEKVWELFNMAPTVNLTREEMNTIHENPHALHITENHLLTSSFAAAWYRLVMNPLTDYQVFYGDMAFLFLDWNEKEDQEGGTPWASEVLSPAQWEMLTAWHQKVMEKRERGSVHGGGSGSGRVVAVVAMHPSVFNPFPEMGDKNLAQNPDTNIFYESHLLDTYSRERDVVDGTFRHRRSEFITLCLGNREYEKDFAIFPERGVDLVLTGHTHRSGVFQVEGPHVYVRVEGVRRGTLFCNAISSGPLGIRNEEGGADRVHLVPPGYHVVHTDRIRVEVRPSDLVAIREEVRHSFGEVARGRTVEVADHVRELPGLDHDYEWKVTNLREGSTITRIRVFTGTTSSPEVVKTPAGWKHSLEEEKGFTTIVCEANDRGQGISYQKTGDVRVKVEGHPVEKMGVLTVNWDMDTTTPAGVRVRVPAEK